VYSVFALSIDTGAAAASGAAYTRAELEDGDVERAAAQVEHRDRAVHVLAEPVGERRGRRLVDDADHVEAGDLAGVLGGLALPVIEVRRHGDDRLLDAVAEVVLEGARGSAGA
jgi:hypothetical protein